MDSLHRPLVAPGSDSEKSPSLSSIVENPYADHNLSYSPSHSPYSYPRSSHSPQHLYQHQQRSPGSFTSSPGVKHLLYPQPNSPGRSPASATAVNAAGGRIHSPLSTSSVYDSYNSNNNNNSNSNSNSNNVNSNNNGRRNRLSLGTIHEHSIISEYDIEPLPPAVIIEEESEILPLPLPHALQQAHQAQQIQQAQQQTLEEMISDLLAEVDSRVNSEYSKVNSLVVDTANTTATTAATAATNIITTATATDATAIQHQYQSLPPIIESPMSEITSHSFAPSSSSSTGFEPTKNSSDSKTKPLKPSLLALSRLSTKSDILFLLVPALICSIGVGVLQPLMTVIFSNTLRSFGHYLVTLSTPATTEKDISVAQAASLTLVEDVRLNCIYFALIGVAIFVASYGQNALWQLFSERTSFRIRVKLIEAILRQDQQWHESMTASKLLDVFNSQVNIVQEGFGQKLGYLVQYISAAVTGIIIAFALGWKLAAVVVAILPLVFCVSYTINRFSSRANKVQMVHSINADIQARQALNEIRTVAAFNTQQHEVNKYAQIMKQVSSHGKYMIMYLTLGASIPLGLVYLAYALALWYGSYLILVVKEMEASRGINVFFALLISIFTLSGIPGMIGHVTISKLTAFDLLRIIQHQPTIIPADDQHRNNNSNSNSNNSNHHHHHHHHHHHQITVIGSPKSKAESTVCCSDSTYDSKSTLYNPVHPILHLIDGQIEFRNVMFAYPSRPHRLALSDLSLTVEAGKRIAFVGPSGAGKSTVLSLIARIYDPIGGQILIDGVPLSALDSQYYRSQIGYVEQEPVLFNGTIRFNVALGCSAHMLSGFDDITADTNSGLLPTQASVVEACKHANIHDFITSLPNGYDTMITDGGRNLSTGQRQRIAIARAFMARPRILLLDEATSALDARNDEAVQAAFAAVSAAAKCTTIVVAHQLQTITGADCIYFVNDGAIAYQGTHRELMDVREYSDFFRALLVKEHKKRQSLRPMSAGMTGLPGLSNSSSMAGASGYASGYVSGYASAKLSHSNSIRSLRGHLLMERATAAAASTATANVTAAQEDEIKVVVDPVNDVAVQGLSTNIDDNNLQLYLTQAIVEKQRNPSMHGPVRRFLSATSNDIHLMILGILGSILEGLIVPVFAVIVAKIIVALTSGSLNAAAARSDSVRYAWIAAVLAVAYFCASFSRSFFLGLASERSALALRVGIFSNLVRHSAAFFDIPGNNGNILSLKMRMSTQGMVAIVSMHLGHAVYASTALLVSFAVGMYLGWKLTLVMFSLLPILTFATFASMSKKKSKNVMFAVKQYESAVMNATEVINSVRTIQLLAREKHFVKQYTDSCLAPHLAVTRNVLRTSIVAAIGQSITYFIYSAGFFLGTKLLLSDANYTPESMLIILYLMVFTASAVGNSTAVLSEFGQSHMAASNAFAMLDNADDESDRLPPPPQTGRITFDETVRPFAGNIEYNDVSFSYPTNPEVPILNGISFKITAGQTIALVGLSGSGKSTVLRLLQQMYLPTDGTITVDGHNICNIDAESLRNQQAIVTQMPVLFEGTIAANIGYGKLDATREDIEQAARDANIHDFIDRLPEKYDTRVGDGFKLSGGEKQRIALARALVRKPKLLLLDEPTSALDVRTERRFFDTLKKTARSRTTVIVAHRLYTIKDASLILVFKDGQIVERGIHRQLMAIKGHYAELVKLQAISSS